MKQYIVKIWIGATKSEVVITADSSPSALRVARLLFAGAIVISAKKA